MISLCIQNEDALKYNGPSSTRHYLKWRLNRYSHFVRRWTAALKSVKSDFVTAPWSTGPGRWWHWMGAPAGEGADAGA